MFSLIGPKRYDAPWRDIEAQGWIAPADCVEVRVTLPTTSGSAYATAEPEERYKVCATSATQDCRWSGALVERHADEPGPGHRRLPRPARTSSAPSWTRR